MRTALIFVFCQPFFCAAQTDTLPVGATRFYTEKKAALALGYNFYFGKKEASDTSSQKFHFLEIGVWQSKFYFHRHWGGFACYAASEIGLDTRKFVIVPKIGCFMAIGPLVLGNDFALYTDFSAYSMRWVPYFGLGDNRFKLTINPHITLSKKDFLNSQFPIGHLHFSCALINLQRKKTNRR